MARGLPFALEDVAGASTARRGPRRGPRPRMAHRPATASGGSRATGRRLADGGDRARHDLGHRRRLLAPGPAIPPRAAACPPRTATRRRRRPSSTTSPSSGRPTDTGAGTPSRGCRPRRGKTSRSPGPRRPERARRPSSSCRSHRRAIRCRALGRARREQVPHAVAHHDAVRSARRARSAAARNRSGSGLALDLVAGDDRHVVGHP